MIIFKKKKRLTYYHKNNNVFLINNQKCLIFFLNKKKYFIIKISSFDNKFHYIYQNIDNHKIKTKWFMFKMFENNTNKHNIKMEIMII